MHALIDTIVSASFRALQIREEKTPDCFGELSAETRKNKELARIRRANYLAKMIARVCKQEGVFSMNMILNRCAHRTASAEMSLEDLSAALRLAVTRKTSVAKMAAPSELWAYTVTEHTLLAVFSAVDKDHVVAVYQYAPSAHHSRPSYIVAVGPTAHEIETARNRGSENLILLARKTKPKFVALLPQMLQYIKQHVDLPAYMKGEKTAYFAESVPAELAAVFSRTRKLTCTLDCGFTGNKDMFSKLRNLMHQPKLSEAQRTDLWELLTQAHAHDGTRYAEQWLVHMQSFPHHFRESLATFESLGELAYAVDIAPHACFSLDLMSSCIGAEGAQALANSPYLVNLSTLSLNGNSIGGDGAQALATSPYLENLTTLKLYGNDIGDEGLRALANSPYLSNLTTLHLAGNRIGIEGARALADSPHLKNLTELVLYWNQIGDEGALALATSPHLANLSTLYLGGNRIGAEGAWALATSSHLTSLATLSISGNYIGDEGAQALANSPYLSNLITLDLKWNEIGAEGAQALANSPHLAKLSTLDLE